LDSGKRKGTQAKLLADSFDLVHMSVGDLLRWNVPNHTKLGAHVRRVVASGQLVDDNVVETVICNRLADDD
jgi:adenylate kinase